MCGIVGYTGTRMAAPILLEGLRQLEYRGYDSAGIAVIHDGQVSLSKVTGRISALAEKTQDGKLLPGTTGIGHTRWATHRRQRPSPRQQRRPFCRGSQRNH